MDQYGCDIDYFNDHIKEKDENGLNSTKAFKLKIV
jgi:hypothetical protein